VGSLALFSPFPSLFERVCSFRDPCGRNVAPGDPHRRKINFLRSCVHFYFQPSYLNPLICNVGVDILPTQMKPFSVVFCFFGRFNHFSFCSHGFCLCSTALAFWNWLTPLPPFSDFLFLHTTKLKWDTGSALPARFLLSYRLVSLL